MRRICYESILLPSSLVYPYSQVRAQLPFFVEELAVTIASPNILDYISPLLSKLLCNYRGGHTRIVFATIKLAF